MIANSDSCPFVKIRGQSPCRDGLGYSTTAWNVWGSFPLTDSVPTASLLSVSPVRVICRVLRTPVFASR